MLVRRTGATIYMTRLTAPAIDWGETRPRLEPFQAGAVFQIGDVEVQSFSVPHDAVDPVGFRFVADGVRIGVVTDLGYIPSPSSITCGARTCCCSKPITISTC